MCKKILGIFKRNKSGFSDEELKWQINILVILFFIILAILIVLIQVTKYNIVIIISILSGMYALAVCVINLSRVIEQMFINKKNKEKQKIFEMLKDKLFIDLEIPNEILEECSIIARMELKKQDETIKIVFNISESEILVREEMLKSNINI